MRGVTKISNSALLSRRCLLRNAAPINGISPSTGTLLIVSRRSVSYIPPRHNRLTIGDQNLSLNLERVSILGIVPPVPVGIIAPILSLLTRKSMMMLLSGVICGVTTSSSTASLNCTVVAPDEAACWYGISTPCLIVASLWFAVITRGVETISPRPSASRADSSRSTR